MPGERERVVKLETRAREAENALKQLRGYIELLRRKSGMAEASKLNPVVQYITP